MVELVHSEPTAELQTRLFRVLSDVSRLRELTRGEARTVYEELEAARDALSLILDRADGKL